MRTNKYMLIPFMLILSVISGCASFDPCGNQVIQRIPAPKDPWEVVVFERDCGATTRKSVQVSIVGLGTRLPNEGGNIFIAEPSSENLTDEVSVRWISNKEIEIRYSPKAKIFKSEIQVKHIHITYGKQ